MPWHVSLPKCLQAGDGSRLRDLCPVLGSFCVSPSQCCSPHSFGSGYPVGQVGDHQFFSSLGQLEARDFAQPKSAVQFFWPAGKCVAEKTCSAEPAHWVKGDVITPAQQSLGSFQEGGVVKEKGSGLNASAELLWYSQVPSGPNKPNHCSASTGDYHLFCFVLSISRYQT
jgi:hypothetical protein